MKTAKIVMIAAAVALMATTASADIKKGQKGYLKTCKNCHGNGTKGAAMHTQAEWEALFANEGESIVQKHAGTKAEAFFSGVGFKGSAQDLRDFLFEYGNDSGNVPSCG